MQIERNKRKRSYLLPETLLNSCTAAEWIPIMKLEATALLQLPASSWFAPLTLHGHQWRTPAIGTLSDGAQKCLVKRLSEATHSPAVQLDRGTDEQIASTKSLYDVFASGPIGTSPSGGVPILTLDKPASLAMYIDFVGKYKFSLNVAEKSGAAIAAHEKDFPGGFQGGYQAVDAPYDLERQSTCIFTVHNKSQAGKLHKNLPKYIGTMATEMAEYIGFKVKFNELHLCFGFSAQSHFTYHQDKQGEWTVVVQLSPGASTIKVAGKEEELCFTGPGDAFMFPSKAFHRSGSKQRRTLTASFFFTMTDKEADASGDDEGEPERDACEAQTPSAAETSHCEGSTSADAPVASLTYA